MHSTTYTVAIRNDYIQVLSVKYSPLQQLFINLRIKKPALRLEFGRAFQDSSNSIYKYKDLLRALPEEKFWPLFNQKEKVSKYSSKHIIDYILKHSTPPEKTQHPSQSIEG